MGRLLKVVFWSAASSSRVMREGKLAVFANRAGRGFVMVGTAPRGQSATLRHNPRWITGKRGDTSVFRAVFSNLLKPTCVCCVKY